jgi:hypothetical protein
MTRVEELEELEELSWSLSRSKISLLSAVRKKNSKGNLTPGGADA